ncbi:histidine kinase [Tenacibaculum aiptasiae]|uniref:Histidine kinase n=2 Tax=Tenacibaculum aiptasiae TaxID=426481 RepID=A0A7J5AMB8_9FLAO|nr:histidine kinase [Tenacibaculum aiptasiae]
MKNILSKNIIRNSIFWGIMFLYLLSSYWYREHDKTYIITYIGFKVFLQFLLCVTIVYYLIPTFLNKKKQFLFVLLSLIAIYLIQSLYGVVRVYYFASNYPEIYKRMPPYILKDRMVSIIVFIRNITWVLFPTVIFIAIKYYRDQKDLIMLKEQKKTTELNLLKNQLNPHFLFNTLNNLYALALKKSDKTPEVIAKLSEILDYILYQCKDNYVSLDKEIELLENYIALEKVRYGNRVEVNFEKQIKSDVKIAPLILLTFVENAFKHGISQEIDKGFITLTIVASEAEIKFKLKNTKPSLYNSNKKRKSIGMENITKQLDFLYLGAYSLEVNETNKDYSLELILKLNEKI